MTVAVPGSAYVQRIWGVFSGATNALMGVTLSGETPYSPIAISLSQSGLPSFLPPSGSVGTNGALTLGTALAQTYANCYMNFPSGAVFSGSPQASYFVQMTSTTVGTIFGNTYSLGTPTVPNAAALQPLTTAGPGAYTQSTSSVQLLAVTLPGGQMGPNGALRLYTIWGFPNNANAKTLAWGWNGATNNIESTSVSTNLSFRNLHYMFNRGAQNNQVCFPGGSAVWGATNSNNQQFATSIDTSQNLTITANATLANATDFVVLDGYSLEVIPG